MKNKFFKIQNDSHMHREKRIAMEDLHNDKNQNKKRLRIRIANIGEFFIMTEANVQNRSFA